MLAYTANWYDWVSAEAAPLRIVHIATIVERVCQFDYQSRISRRIGRNDDRLAPMPTCA